MCGCNKNKDGGMAAEQYVVTRSNGTTKTFSSEPDARIDVAVNGGTYIVKKK